MIRFRTFESLAEAEFVAGLLASKGIPCEARDRIQYEPMGDWPAVWIFRQEDFHEATRILDVPPTPRGRLWNCAKCRTENDAQFDACWSCGGQRSSGG